MAGRWYVAGGGRHQRWQKAGRCRWWQAQSPQQAGVVAGGESRTGILSVKVTVVVM